MQYLITNTSVVRVNETSGVIQNTGQYPLELSNSETFAEIFVLDSSKTVSFKGKLFIRVCDKNTPHAIKANVVNFITDGAAISGDTTADEMLDSIFGGDSDTVPNESVVSNEEFNEYMDGIFGGDG